MRIDDPRPAAAPHVSPLTAVRRRPDLHEYVKGRVLEGFVRRSPVQRRLVQQLALVALAPEQQPNEDRAADDQQAQQPEPTHSDAGSTTTTTTVPYATISLIV